MLFPDLRKEAASEEGGGAQSSVPPRSRFGPTSPSSPPREPGGVPVFPRGPAPLFPGARNPLSIGDSDRDPISGNPFRPFPFNSEDGSVVGPNHPIFGIGGRPQRGSPFGGDSFLPPGAHPPGARFDPIGPGPFGVLPGGVRRPPRSGDPDNDELQPPGWDNVSE